MLGVLCLDALSVMVCCIYIGSIISWFVASIKVPSSAWCVAHVQGIIQAGWQASVEVLSRHSGWLLYT
jgi:hypothetical protein